MKFACFDTTEDTLLTISGWSALGYGAQMAAAPDLQHRLYFKEHVPKSTQWTQWFGNGLIMAGVPTFSMNNMGLTKAQKKTALKGCAVNHSLTSALMTKQMVDGDFNKQIGIPSAVIHAGMAIACALVSRADDKKEEE